MIPYGHQDISEEDIRAVEEVLRSDWLTQGPAVERFEQAVAEYCGVSHTLATCNATAALHLACRALGLGPGDLLWTSPNTFVASANCGRFCGANVDFVDIDPRTYNMSAEELDRKLRDAERRGRLPKVVIPVHFAGEPCDMQAIHDLAKRYGFYVIEDASHAVGARYRDTTVGSCAYSDITVFSFHPVKIITTGEGGMALTRNKELYEKMLMLRSHGIVRDAGMQAREGSWYYEQTELGFNYRLTDLQSALGISQLSRLDSYLATRQRLVDRYDALVADLPITRPWRDPKASSAWHLYVVLLHEARHRRAVFDHMRAAGIGVNVHYIPVHLQPDYRRLGFAGGYCPVAEDYYTRALTLPLFPGLSESQQDYVVEVLRNALNWE